MSFFEWWFKNKKKDTHQSPIDALVKNIGGPSRPPILSANENPAFSHLPPISIAPLSHEEFSVTLKEELKKDSTPHFSRQRLIEALRLTQLQGVISDEHKAAMIMGLVGKEEAAVVWQGFKWKNGVYCPRCRSTKVKWVTTEQGFNVYRCLDCEDRHGQSHEQSRFNALTGHAFEHDITSVIRWVLICYLKMFCSISKIAKLLNLSVDEALQLLALVNQDESLLPKAKKKSDKTSQ